MNSGPTTTTNASFTGVFSLKTQDQVDQLVLSVKAIVERGVNILHVADRHDLVNEVLGHVSTVVRLSSEFIDLTLDDIERQRAQSVVNQLANSERELRSIFAAHGGGKLPDDLAQKVASHMRNILERIADLTDMMEDNQNQRGLRTVKQAFESLVLLRDPNNNYSFDSKANHAERALDNFCRLTDNRLQVTEDSALKSQLESIKRTVETQKRPLIDAARQVSYNSSPSNVEAQNRILEQVAAAIKQLLEMLQNETTKVLSSCDFSHEKINQALDALVDAIKQGATQDATDQARIIVDQVNGLARDAGLSGGESDAERRAREALKLSADALRNMTKRLVDATKQALNDPSKCDDATRAVEEVKAQVANVAPPTPRRQNDGLRATLLSASKELSSGLGGVVDTLQ